MKKGGQPILYVLSSLSSFLLDVGLYHLLNRLLSGVLGPEAAVAVSNLTARALSSFFNFNMNRLVFRSAGNYGGSLLRYYCLCVPQAFASTGLITLLAALFRTGGSGWSTVIKVAVDSVLFVASFFIQKYWVFAKKDSKAGAEPRRENIPHSNNGKE